MYSGVHATLLCTLSYFRVKHNCYPVLQSAFFYLIRIRFLSIPGNPDHPLTVCLWAIQDLQFNLLSTFIDTGEPGYPHSATDSMVKDPEPTTGAFCVGITIMNGQTKIRGAAKHVRRFLISVWAPACCWLQRGNDQSHTPCGMRVVCVSAIRNVSGKAKLWAIMSGLSILIMSGGGSCQHILAGMWLAWR